MLADRRLIVVERADDVLHTLGTRAMHPGDTVTVGRAAELPLGHTHDARVSRLAMTVTCTDDGWTLEATNRNGILIHPWGLPPRYSHRDETTDAARVALRVVGSIVREHWVLLEDDTRLGTGPADQAARPAPAQLEALRLLFPDLIEWPPALAEWPPGIEQVAAALGVTAATVRGRLDGLRTQALALGLPPEVGIDDPEYVHLLVQAGHLRPDQFPTH